MAKLYNNVICVLVSGGLDSAVLAGNLARRQRVLPVYIRQGLAWENVELYWLKRFLKALRHPRVLPLKILSLPMADVYGAHWSLGGKAVPGYRSHDRAVYLPGRNLILVVKTAVMCAIQGIRQIALGSLGHNPFPDASPAFFKQWSRTLSLGLKAQVIISTPFRDLSKIEVIRRGRSLPLEFSFSCLAPVGKMHCGRCNKCAERQKAFRRAGVVDKTRYAKV